MYQLDGPLVVFLRFSQPAHIRSVVRQDITERATVYAWTLVLAVTGQLYALQYGHCFTNLTAADAALRPQLSPGRKHIPFTEFSAVYFRRESVGNLDGCHNHDHYYLILIMSP